jgi:two-component system sensor histidine kinase PhoQ
VLLPSLAFTVSTAFKDSLLKAKQTELESMAYALIATFEISGSRVNMPFNVFDDRLNMPQSGYQAFIVLNQTVVWQSTSSTLQPTPLDYPSAKTGEQIFADELKSLPDTFLFTFTAEFESENQFIPIKFYLLEDQDAFHRELATFNQSLFRNGVWIALLISGLLLLSLLSVVSPVKHLVSQLSKAAKGTSRQDGNVSLNGVYPKELNAVKDSVNALLLSESQQRTRFKHALQDLAHSLKTPLSILQGDTAIPESSKAPILQIDQIIQRQLSRSVLGKAGWQQRIDLYDLLNKIIESMHKIYRDKHLQITCDNAPLNFTYPIDTTDAYELFGNILDNACKAARTTVTVTFTTEANAQIISIIDDGPGIPEALQADVLTRGKRLDTYHQGHGIGLATVSDLVEMYGATLQVISPITDTEGHIESRNEESFSEQSIVVNQAGTRISVCLPNN